MINNYKSTEKMSFGFWKLLAIIFSENLENLTSVSESAVIDSLKDLEKRIYTMNFYAGYLVILYQIFNVTLIRRRKLPVGHWELEIPDSTVENCRNICIYILIATVTIFFYVKNVQPTKDKPLAFTLRNPFFVMYIITSTVSWWSTIFMKLYFYHIYHKGELETHRHDPEFVFKPPITDLPYQTVSFSAAMYSLSLNLLYFSEDSRVPVAKMIFQILIPTLGIPAFLGPQILFDKDHPLFFREYAAVIGSLVVGSLVATVGSRIKSFYLFYLNLQQSRLASMNFALAKNLDSERQLQDTLKSFTAYLFHEVRVPLNAVVFGLGTLKVLLKDINPTSLQAFEIGRKDQNAKRRKSMNTQQSSDSGSPNTKSLQMLPQSLTASLSIDSKSSKQADWQQVWQMQSDIEICLNRATIILNRVLDFNSLENGVLKMNLQEFDLIESVSESISILEPMSISKRILVDMEFRGKLLESEEKGLKCSVTWDRSRYQEILTNFLSNAIKYTPMGGNVIVAIKLSSHEAQEDIALDHMVETSIIDNGPGISAENQAKLFIPFTQVNTKDDNGGKISSSGLGLSICKKIVEMSHGKIKVESELGNGSKFTFSIPMKVKIIETLVYVNNEKQSVIKEKDQLVNNDMYRYHLLDSQSVKDIQGNLLKNTGYLKSKSYSQGSSFKIGDSAKISFASLNELRPSYTNIPLIACENNVESGIKKSSKSLPAKILIVEDDVISSKVVSTGLAKSGYKCLVASNGKEALRVLKEEPDIDVILLDRHMPEMDGIEFLDHAKASGMLSKVKVIATSGVGEDEQQEFIKHGANMVLPKPVRLEDLKNIINKA